jgi:hypothetical protein
MVLEKIPRIHNVEFHLTLGAEFEDRGLTTACSGRAISTSLTQGLSLAAARVADARRWAAKLES